MDKISTDVHDDYDLPDLPVLSPKKIKTSTYKAGARAPEKASGRATEKANGRATEKANGRATEKANGRATEKAGGLAAQKAGARAIGFGSSTDTEVSWFDSSPQGFKRMTAAQSRCVICE
jgi:hypothetical protein